MFTKGTLWYYVITYRMNKIAVVSGKGGAGKTSVTVMLTDYFRNKNASITLVDLDVEEPNAQLFFKGKQTNSIVTTRPIPAWDANKCTFCGKCTKVCNFQALAMLPQQVLVFEELCHSCYACTELCPENALPMKERPMGKMNTYQKDMTTLIEGLLNIGEQQAVPLIAQAKDRGIQIAENDDYLFFDAPPGTSCPMIEAVREVDYVLLVSEETNFGLNDMQLTVETLRELNLPFGVIINKANQQATMVENYCRKENLTVIGKIPYSEIFAKSYATGNLNDTGEESITAALETIYQFIQEKFAAK